MQRSKSITDQLEGLIKKAKKLSFKHDILENDKNNDDTLDDQNIYLNILSKRQEICFVQKNTIIDLIKLHKEEIYFLESALRNIEEEEKRIKEILSKEMTNNDFFSKATSIELIENDNLNSQNNIDNSNTNNSSFEKVIYIDEDYEKYNNYIQTDNIESEESLKNESDSSKNNSSSEPDKYHHNSDRRVRFSAEDLSLVLDRKSSSGSISGRKNIRSKYSLNSTISIPQRFNYIRNRNSSLLKDISINKILNNTRKPDSDESNLDQKAVIRQLHTIYGTKK